MNKWKQLNIERLQEINKRVPVSFKIDSEFKLDLYQEAFTRNQDISTYIRSIVEERQKIERYGKLQAKYQILLNELSTFKFSEGDVLFQKFKGKQIQYSDNGLIQ